MEISLSLSLSLSLSSITGFSQISVMHYPQHKEGWLVMQNQENLYSRWTVLGFQVLNQNSSSDTIPKDVFELVGKNYFAMPEVYWNPNELDTNAHYFFTVVGHKGNGQKDTLSSPLFVTDNITFQRNACTYHCEGNTYAYNIYVDEFVGNDVVRLSNFGMPLANGLYKTRSYEYMKKSSLDALYASAYWRSYYNLTNISYDEYHSNVLKLTNNPNIQYKDKDGFLIVTNGSYIYAVDKTMGKWRGKNINYETGNANFLCSLGESGIINNFNSNFNFQSIPEEHSNQPLPDLYCSSWSSPYELQELDDSGLEWIDCVSNLIDPQNEVGSPTNVISWIEKLRGCADDAFSEMSFFDANEVIVNYANLWPEYVAKILLRHTDGIIAPIELDYADMLNENNVFVGKSFNTPAGLYEVMLFGENAEIITLLVEVKEDIFNQFQMKDFLQVNLFPNPISGNSYNITFTASSDISFEYKMFDTYGNVQEHKNYIMKSGSALDETFSAMVNEYPEGIMVHQFLFSDGSVKTVTGLKVSPY